MAKSRALMERHRARERDGVGVKERRACRHGLLGGLQAPGLEHCPELVTCALLLPVASDPDEGPDGAPGHLVHIVYPDGLGSPHLGAAAAMGTAVPLPPVVAVPVPRVLAQAQPQGVGVKVSGPG